MLLHGIVTPICMWLSVPEHRSIAKIFLHVVSTVSTGLPALCWWPRCICDAAKYLWQRRSTILSSCVVWADVRGKRRYCHLSATVTGLASQCVSETLRRCSKACTPGHRYLVLTKCELCAVDGGCWRSSLPCRRNTSRTAAAARRREHRRIHCVPGPFSNATDGSDWHSFT